MWEIVRHIGGQCHFGQSLRAIGSGDGELAVLELDIRLGGFEQMGGDLATLGDDLVHCLDDRAATDGGRTRAIGTHAVGDLGAVAVDDLDTVERDAEPVRDQLRKGRLVSLPMAVRTGQHGNAAGRVHADRGALEEAGTRAQ